MRIWKDVLSAIVVAAIVIASVGAMPASAAAEVPCTTVPAGWSCVPLLNKGTGASIGEMMYQRSGDDLTMLTNLFVAPDVGHTDWKLCVDDDGTPHGAKSCLGGTVGGTWTSGTSCVPAPGAGEEASGKYEYKLERAAIPQTTASLGGLTVARFAACVGAYRYFSLHFNQGSYSVESFFTSGAKAPPPPPPPPPHRRRRRRRHRRHRRHRRRHRRHRPSRRTWKRRSFATWIR